MDYGKEPLLPAIPDLRTGRVEDAVQVMKEWIEVRQGARGDGLDRAVTMRDLLNTGLATGAQLGPIFSGPAPIPLIPAIESPDIPPTPTDLSAAGAITTIILTWEFARGYSRLAYFEVWRSATNAIGTAVKVAQPEATSYADVVGSGAVFYYWVRAVSDAGVSPFNALAGVRGETALNTEEVIDAITDEINDSGLLDQLTVKTDGRGYASGWGLASTPSNGSPSYTFAVLANRFFVAPPVGEGGDIERPLFTVQTTPTTINGVNVPPGVYMTSAFFQNGVITNAKIGNLAVDDAKIASMNVNKLTAGQLGVSAYIESTNYLSGSTGWRINGNGNAEFSNVTVRGTVIATAGSIGGTQIDTTGMQSSNYNGVVGWRINGDGSALFGSNVTFRGQLSGATGSFSGSLSGATGTFSGSLSAASGTFYGSGTFSGNLSAAGGTFAGKLTASAIDAVDTLNVAGNAITGLAAATGGASSVPSGGETALCAASLNMPSGSAGVLVSVNVALNSASNSSQHMRIYKDGAMVAAAGVSLLGGFATTAVFTWMDSNPSVGYATYSFHVANPTVGPGSNVPATISSSAIVLSGAKR